MKLHNFPPPIYIPFTLSSPSLYPPSSPHPSSPHSPPPLPHPLLDQPVFSTVVADYCVLVVALLQDGEEAVREEMAGSVGILLAHISPLVGESWRLRCVPFRIHRSQLYEFRAVYIVIIMHKKFLCNFFSRPHQSPSSVKKAFPEYLLFAW